MTGEMEIDPRKLAAVVYDDRVSIDSLVAEFASDLSSTGIRIAGFIQVARDEAGCGPGAPMCLLDVATGQILPMCRDLGQQGQTCRLDLERFDAAASGLVTACEGDADLIFVSRFGKMEAHGRGFREGMARAVERGRPMLTAVRRGLVHSWFAFTGEVGTVLDARLWVLKQWWREIAPAPR